MTGGVRGVGRGRREEGLDERGEGLRGGVLLTGGRRASLAAVLPDERAVLVHARCMRSHDTHMSETMDR